eukprot:CAMPEP_0179057844 /NCGR_PEP_ID=MMETSP0796-20121207/24543_1 /TAXON_ID=73915 /ORGANISM="Pyrodinium bahamense, Strain pbaha01" /LENGTH=204 /DNA_ID=CAMNT_0020754575 /DNA_START=136 /DNA_END=750 /DNA_ORIENTATION=+
MALLLLPAVAASAATIATFGEASLHRARDDCRTMGAHLMQLSSRTRLVVGQTEDNHRQQHAEGGSSATAGRSGGGATAAEPPGAAVATGPADSGGPSTQSVADDNDQHRRGPATLLQDWAQRLSLQGREDGDEDLSGIIIASVVIAVLVLFLLLLYRNRWNVGETMQEIEEDPRAAFYDARDTGRTLWTAAAQRRQDCAEKPCC